MARRNNPEEQLHLSVAQLLCMALQPSVVWTTIETSNQTSNIRKQGILKAKGVMAGYPDIQILWHDDGVKALCIELKAPKGVLSKNQIKVHAILAKVGVPTVIARSLEDVQTALDVYNVPHRNIHLTRL